MSLSLSQAQAAPKQKLRKTCQQSKNNRCLHLSHLKNLSALHKKGTHPDPPVTPLLYVPSENDIYMGVTRTILNFSEDIDGNPFKAIPMSAMFYDPSTCTINLVGIPGLLQSRNAFAVIARDEIYKWIEKVKVNSDLIYQLHEGHDPKPDVCNPATTGFLMRPLYPKPPMS